MKKRRTSEEKFDDELAEIASEAPSEPQKLINTTKKETNMKKTIILTVAITLITIAAFAFTFYMGARYESGRSEAISTEAAQLVEKLKSQSK